MCVYLDFGIGVSWVESISRGKQVMSPLHC